MKENEFFDDSGWPEYFRKSRKYRALPQAEQARIMALDSSEIWNAFLQVKMITGMRTGEALALCWGDVDVQARKMWIRGQLPEGAQVRVIRNTKNFRWRQINMPDILIEILEKIRGKTEGVLYRKERNDFVFCDAQGHPLNAMEMNAYLKDVLGREDAKLHELRVTAGTVMYNVTGDARAAADLLGHVSPDVTVRYYLDVPRDLETGASAQDAYYARLHNEE